MGIFDWLFKKKEYPELYKKLKSGEITQEQYDKTLRTLKNIKADNDEKIERQRVKRNKEFEKLEKQIDKNQKIFNQVRFDPEVLVFSKHLSELYYSQINRRGFLKERDKFVIKYKERKESAHVLKSSDFKDSEVILFIENQKKKYLFSHFMNDKEWDDFVIRYTGDKKRRYSENGKETS